jgi:hypothetical protein
MRRGRTCGAAHANCIMIGGGKTHYDCCLTAAPPAVESERGARTGYLRACRGR